MFHEKKLFLSPPLPHPPPKKRSNNLSKLQNMQRNWDGKRSGLNLLIVNKKYIPWISESSLDSKHSRNGSSGRDRQYGWKVPLHKEAIHYPQYKLVLDLSRGAPLPFCINVIFYSYGYGRREHSTINNNRSI